jgi:antirestriction protein ArdC
MATSDAVFGTQACSARSIREEFIMHEDLYAKVTARIIAALEQGVAPWVRPWSTVADALPMNAQTRRPYRGINFTLLSLEATAHGYPLNRWTTYRQALELGGQVRKGERGTTVVFWKLGKIGATADAYPDPGESDLHDAKCTPRVHRSAGLPHNNAGQSSLLPRTPKPGTRCHS